MLRAFVPFSARIPSRCLLVLATTTALSASPDLFQQPARPGAVRIDEAIRRDGDALVAMADARARGEQVPSDFAIEWRNDFLKARPGTFVPFTVSFPAAALAEGPALLYVRVEAAGPVRPGRTRTPREYAYETIFPIRIDAAQGEGRFRVRRGFAIAPGSYKIVVVLRGSSAEPSDPRRPAAWLERTLEVPDFWSPQLATSTVILAERIEKLTEPVPAAELDEDPYVVGSLRVHPAATATYNRRAELIVVFLVYNPTVTRERQFDVQVDYHLFREVQGGDPRPAGGRGEGPAARPGEYYVTRTSPQRFTPAMMGSQFDPSSGDPVLAGQAIPLASFDPGTYRLNIVVTDLLSRRTLSRDVTFAVVGS
jgi:hypothetical protein